MDYTATFYSRPSYVGSGPIFVGVRRQRGGSILGALKSVVLPIMATVGPKLLKSVGNIAKRQAFGLASDLLSAKIRGKNMTDSLKQHGKTRLFEGASQGLNSIGNMMNVPTAASAPAPKRRKRSWRIGRGRQGGSGIKKRRSAAKQKRSRKRRASSKRGPPRKRARANF